MRELHTLRSSLSSDKEDMRNLRSGKPLPDPPPVKKGRVGQEQDSGEGKVEEMEEPTRASVIKRREAVSSETKNGSSSSNGEARMARRLRSGSERPGEGEGSASVKEEAEIDIKHEPMTMEVDVDQSGMEEEEGEGTMNMGHTDVGIKIKAEDGTRVTTTTTPIPTTSPTPELRRSLRCPKKKETFQIEIPTMAVERDANYKEKCKVCGIEFRSRSSYQKHMRAHSKEMSPGIQTPSHSRSVVAYQVKQSQSFHEEEMDMDMDEDPLEFLHPSRIKNPMVDFARKRPSFQSTAQQNPARCHLCGMTFTRRAHLNRHILLHSGLKPYECDVCKSTFARKDHMYAHRSKHFATGKLVTNIPRTPPTSTSMTSSSFARRVPVGIHQQRVSTPSSSSEQTSEGETPISCELCGKVFRQRRYLREHKKLHLRKEAAALHHRRMQRDQEYQESFEDGDGEGYDVGEDVLQPEVNIEDPLGHHWMAPSNEGENEDADDVDVDADNLDELIEFDYKAMKQGNSQEAEEEEEEEDMGLDDLGIDDESSPNMECCVCGTQFTDRGELRKHYRIHKRRFICRFCGARLASAGSLMRHNRTHTGRKDFACKLCDRKFSRKDTLFAHMQTHERRATHPGVPKPFACKVCGARYSMKINLILHLRRNHGKRDTVLNRAQDMYSVSPSEGTASMRITKVEPSTSAMEGENQENANETAEHNEEDGTPEQGQGEEDTNGHQDQDESENNRGNSPTEEELKQCEEDEVKPDDAFQATLAGNGFMCNHCGKLFKNIKSLNTHKWYHSRDKQFICHICNRGFKYSTDLGRHINTHGKDATARSGALSSSAQSQPKTVVATMTARPATATNTSSPFQRQLRVRPQMLRPAFRPRGIPVGAVDTRPFSCKLCPQRFNHRSNLSRHMRLIHKVISSRSQSSTLNHQNQNHQPHPQVVQNVVPDELDVQEQEQPVVPARRDLGEIVKQEITTINYQNPPEREGEEQFQVIVRRTVRRGEDGALESDEEFIEESDSIPNTVPPGTIPPFEIEAQEDEDEFDEDDLEYASMTMPGGSFQSFRPSPVAAPVSMPGFLSIPPCELCGKQFTGKKQRADHVWYCKRARKYRCPVVGCGKDFKLKHDIIRHLIRHANERRHACKICSARFPHKIDVMRHMRRNHSFQVRLFACDFCEYNFGRDFELSNHLQVRHGLEWADVYDTEDGEELIPTPSGSSYGEDYDDSMQESFMDGEDEDGVPDPSAFLEQSISMGTSSATAGSSNSKQHQQYQCTICNKNFPDRQKWMYHRYYHIREEKYDCPEPECVEKFKLRSHLERHIKTYHNEEKPVQRILSCRFCPRKFTRDYDLMAHVQKVHTRKPTSMHQQRFSAPTTTATSSGPTPGRTSMPIHKPMPKLIPGKPAQVYVKPAIISPSKVKLLKPPLLAKGSITMIRKSWPVARPQGTPTMQVMKLKPPVGVPTRSELGDIIMMKPNGQYYCRPCGKSFSEKKAADAHRYYHNREEKHFCTGCNARFKQRSDLRRHISIHHNSQNPRNITPCPYCYRSFTDLRYMRMHIRRYHPGNGTDESSTPGSTNGIIEDEEFQQGEVEVWGDGEEPSPDPDVQLEEEEEDPDQKTMAEVEYLEYQSEEPEAEDQPEDEEIEEVNITQPGSSSSIVINCENCGEDVDAFKIEDHDCPMAPSRNGENNHHQEEEEEEEYGEDLGNDEEMEMEGDESPSKNPETPPPS